MNTSALPFHKNLRHPRTGKRLQAVGFRRDHSPIWPVLGGDDTEPTAEEKAAADKAAADKAAVDKAAAHKAAADKADADKDLGFPKDTPVGDMKPAEQAKFYQHQSRKQEERNKEWLAAAGGKTAEQLKADAAELERLRNEKRTDAEKAVEDAKKATRDEVTKEFVPKLVTMAFNTALAHITEEDRKDLIGALNLSNFITDSGEVDTEKVSKYAEKIAPAGKGPGGQVDYGGGRHGRTPPPGAGGGSVAAVIAERRAAREAAKQTANSN